MTEPDNEVEPVTDEGAEHARLVVRKDLTLRRLDQYIQGRFPQFSRSAVQKLIEAGAVRVNDQEADKPSRRLGPGDVVDIVLPPPPPKDIQGEPIPLEIIYEDDCMMAVNKQAGLVVHPARGNPHGTLVNALVYYAAGRLSAGSDPFRPGIVHRLDRDTTGVMLVAKTDEAHWRLSRQFEARRVHKEYVAVVHGRMQLDADRIDAPLARDKRVRERFAVSFADPDAKPAVTTWRVLTRYRGFSLVQLEPLTGRTHQLRVHMAHIRHPIVGDIDYGGKRVTRAQLADQVSVSDKLPDAPLIQRQALHARVIRFRHPLTGKPMELAAPIPADFQALIDALEEFRAN